MIFCEILGLICRTVNKKYGVFCGSGGFEWCSLLLFSGNLELLLSISENNLDGFVPLLLFSIDFMENRNRLERLRIARLKHWDT